MDYESLKFCIFWCTRKREFAIQLEWRIAFRKGQDVFKALLGKFGCSWLVNGAEL